MATPWLIRDMRLLIEPFLRTYFMTTVWLIRDMRTFIEPFLHSYFKFTAWLFPFHVAVMSVSTFTVSWRILAG